MSDSPPNFEWFISLGNVLSIVISVSVVIGAIVTLVRYLRKNVTAEVVNLRTDVKEDLNHIKEKMDDNQKLTSDNFASAKERLEELRYSIEKTEKRIEENKHELNRALELHIGDVDKKLEERAQETAKLIEKLDSLREEYHRLALQVTRSFQEKAQRGSNQGDNDAYW